MPLLKQGSIFLLFIRNCAVYSTVIARPKSPLALMSTEGKGRGVTVDRAWPDALIVRISA